MSTLITISPHQYDINGGLQFLNTSNSGAAGSAFRFTRSQLTDGTVHFFNGGYAAGDNTFELSIEPHTLAQFDKVKEWVENTTQLRLCLTQGIYIGYITAYRQNGIELSVTFTATGTLTNG